MNKIKFKVDMRCERAARDHNEDDCCLIVHLADGQPGFTPDKEFLLDEKGALLVVCDGMGGMNAGEAASKRAVETIREWFAPANLTGEKMATPEAVRQYIVKAIIDADSRIKKESSADRTKEGMGSTAVLAWIKEQRVYVGWCGDSRAYRFNPVDGLKQLSHDHSYVQELVDAGSLSEELAFDHPHSNIITRSLGDPSGAARPDVNDCALRNGDVILLCSDGLCGVLRDAEIEAIMRRHTGSMRACRDALWEAARDAGWHDNVTIELCQILSGCSQIAAPPDNTENEKPQAKPNTGWQTGKWLWILVAIAALSVGVGLVAGYFFSKKAPATDPSRNDSIKEAKHIIVPVCERPQDADAHKQKINGEPVSPPDGKPASLNRMQQAQEPQRIYKDTINDNARFIMVSILPSDSTLTQILNAVKNDAHFLAQVDTGAWTPEYDEIEIYNPQIEEHLKKNGWVWIPTHKKDALTPAAAPN
ncbi:MAG: protein phosphatase 2C domain-containing protein [Prevotellaceae bacterium]|jgi:serine/threonine protein phosphatase PrpC|nr:protein phosphatase 2C domain-containing protein [Prevotellaceae bacterium]